MNKLKFLPMILTLLYAGYTYGLPLIQTPETEVAFTPNPDELQQIASLQLDQTPQGKEVGNMCFGLAVVIENDQAQLKSTADVQELIGRASVSLIQVPGLMQYWPQIEQPLEQFLGYKGQKPELLTPQIRQDIVRKLRTIWYAST